MECHVRRAVEQEDQRRAEAHHTDRDHRAQQRRCARGSQRTQAHHQEHHGGRQVESSAAQAEDRPRAAGQHAVADDQQDGRCDRGGVAMLVAVLQEPRTAFGQAQGTGEHGVVAGIA